MSLFSMNFLQCISKEDAIVESDWSCMRFVAASYLLHTFVDTGGGGNGVVIGKGAWQGPLFKLCSESHKNKKRRQSTSPLSPLFGPFPAAASVRKIRTANHFENNAYAMSYK